MLPHVTENIAHLSAPTARVVSKRLNQKAFGPKRNNVHHTLATNSTRSADIICKAAQQQESPTTDGAPLQTMGGEYFKTDSRAIILFDGVCNLCNNGVNFMLDWDKQGRCRFAALQSPAGRKLLQRSGRAPDDISSIVLVEKNQSYIKSEAILRIAQRLEIPFPILAGLGLLVPLGFRDWFYDGVADNRYNLWGQSDQCRLSDGRFEERFLSE